MDEGSQFFIIATHAPIILSFAESLIYELDHDRIHRVSYDDTETVRVTREFLIKSAPQ